MAKTYNAATQTITGDRVHIYAAENLGDADIENFNFASIDPIAFGTSCSVELSAETIDMSNKMGGNWKNTRVGQMGWTAQIEALYSTDTAHNSFDKLLAAAAERKVIGVALGIVATTEDEFDKAAQNGFVLDSSDPIVAKGKAFITSINANYGTGNEVVSYSVTLTGDGKLYTGGTAGGTTSASE